MEKIIKYFVWFIVIIIWAFIGLFFWIAILARVIASAIIKTMIVMLDNNNSSDKAFNIPDGALNFYINGFVTIYNSILEKDGKYVREEFNLRRIIVDIIWAFVFWALFFLCLGSSIGLDIF
ncbi:MAG: hypothetical protein AAGA77_13310 [Bacteroidota bacterium]